MWMVLGGALLGLAAGAAGCLALRRGAAGRAEAHEELRDARRREAELAAELAAAREALERAEEGSRRVLAAVAHDLRSPLAAVIGGIELARTSGGEVARRGLDLAERSARMVIELAEDLVDAEAARRGALSICARSDSVERVVSEVVDAMSVLAAARGLRLVVDLDGLPEMVELDARRVRQVLINLVGNAIRYTEQGTVTVRAAWRAGCLHLAVQDTGPGMGPEEQAALFQPFRRGRTAAGTRGHGLGLALCAELVERMGGAITCESRPGQGTTFRVVIPAPEVREAASA